MKKIILCFLSILSMMLMNSCSKDKDQSVEKSPSKSKDVENSKSNKVDNEKKEFTFSLSSTEKNLGNFSRLSSLKLRNGKLVFIESIKNQNKERVNFMDVGSEKLQSIDFSIKDELANIPVNGKVYKTNIDDLILISSNGGLYFKKAFTRSYTQKNGDDSMDGGGLFYKVQDGKLQYLTSILNSNLYEGLHLINFIPFVGNDELYGTTIHQVRKKSARGVDYQLNLLKCPQYDCSKMIKASYKTYSDIEWDMFKLMNVSFDDDHLFITAIAGKGREENLSIIKINEFLDEEFDMVTDSSKSGEDDNIDLFKVPLVFVTKVADTYFSDFSENILIKGYSADFKPSLLSVKVSENNGEATISKNLESNIVDVKDIHSISHSGVNYIFLYSTKTNPEKRFISVVNSKNGNVVKINGEDYYDTGLDIPYEKNAATGPAGQSRLAKYPQGQAIAAYKDGKIYIYRYLYTDRSLIERVIEVR